MVGIFANEKVFVHLQNEKATEQNNKIFIFLEN